MKEKFRQFMTGRYGADQLSRFIMACGMVTLVCYMIFRGSLWYYLTLILLVWNYYRALSRNYEKRYQENTASTAAPAVNRRFVYPEAKEKSRLYVRNAIKNSSAEVKYIVLAPGQAVAMITM